MDINVRYDVSDISAQLVSDVKATIDAEVKAQIARFTAEFHSKATALFSDLTAMLDIKDRRQRERIQASVTTSLDKWIKRGLSSGK